MEIKTCEEYVLKELENKTALCEHQRAQITEITKNLQLLINVLNPVKVEEAYNFTAVPVEQYESIIGTINQILNS